MPERRRVKQTRSLEERMAEQAAKLKTMADRLPAGAERDRKNGLLANWEHRHGAR